MDLYGQSALAKHMNDSKNIERNYWRVFKELEASKRRVAELEGKVVDLTEENKKLKASKPKKSNKKVVSVKETEADPVDETDASEEVV